MAARKPWWAAHEDACEKRSGRPDSVAEIAHELAFAQECTTWFAKEAVHDCA